MSEKLHVKFSGLNTSNNPFSTEPEGSFSQLDNCIMREAGIMESRRGYTLTPPHPSGATILRTFPWKGVVLCVLSNGMLASYNAANGWTSLAYNGPNAGTAINIPATAVDAANPVRGVSFAKGFYLTTSTGVRVVDKVDLGGANPAVRQLSQVGLEPPPYLTASLYVPDSAQLPTFLQSGWSVAYVAVSCGYSGTDFTQLVQSAPSPRLVVTNNFGGPVGVYVTAAAPVGGARRNINFYQLYRTLQAPPGVSPSGEYFEVTESVPLGPNYTGVAFQIDGTSDANGTGSPLLSKPLYTNEFTGGGAGVSNDPVPLARDLCGYNNRMLYANSVERHTINMQLIGTQGLNNGSTVVIGGNGFTAAASESFPYQFQLTTTGTPAQNIEATARSLCRCISNTGRAGIYRSGPNDPPGLFSIVEGGAIGGAAFTFNAGQDGQACWVPDCSLAATIQTSSNNRQPAKLWWSNIDQPWGVPVDNWAIVGEADQEILRVVKVRNTAFIFKKDGLYTLQGNAPPYQVQPFDPGLVLLAPESCTVVDNQVYCLTNRGVVYVSDAGVTPAVSGPVDRDLNVIQAAAGQYTTMAFATPYESDGLYLLAMPSIAGDTTCPQQYVWNSQTPSWSRWVLPLGITHGCFDPVQYALVFAAGSSLLIERRSFTSLDYQDLALTVTPAASTSSKSLNVGTTPIFAGDIISQGSINARVVTGNASSAYIPMPNVTVTGSGPVTLDAAYSFTATPATVTRAINCTWKLSPIVVGDPTIDKVFETVFLSFKQAGFQFVGVGFDSEKNPNTTSAIKPGPTTTALAPSTPNFLIRIDQPQNMMQCVSLGMAFTHQQARSFWQLQGLSTIFSASSGIPRRG